MQNTFPNIDMVLKLKLALAKQSEFIFRCMHLVKQNIVNIAY